MKGLAVDFAKKPDVTALRLHSEVSGAVGEEAVARQSYLAYKNNHRCLARGGENMDDLDDCTTFIVPSRPGAPLPPRPTEAAATSHGAQEAQPSTSGVASERQATSSDVVVISDDEDEEPYLDLTGSADQRGKTESDPRQVSLVCDNTPDGKPSVFVNNMGHGSAGASSVGPGLQDVHNQSVAPGSGASNIASVQATTNNVSRSMIGNLNNPATRSVTVPPGFFLSSTSVQNPEGLLTNNPVFQFATASRQNAVQAARSIHNLLGNSSLKIASTSSASQPVPVATVQPMQSQTPSRTLVQITPKPGQQHPKCTCPHRHVNTLYIPKTTGEPQSGAGDAQAKSGTPGKDGPVIVID